MARTLVFTTQEAALAAQISIETRIRAYAAAAGYSTDGSGVWPKTRSGIVRTDAMKSTSFTPVSGSGSSWSIPHPEYHSLRREAQPSLGMSFSSYALQDVSLPSISGSVDTDDPTRPCAPGWVKSSGGAAQSGLAGVGTFFDPWIVKDGSAYIMYVSWRGAGGLARLTSTDGITWSAPTVVLAASAVGSANRACVLKISTGDWRMWYTRQLGLTMNIHYATSTDGIMWTTSDTPILTPTQVWESQTNPVVQQPVVIWDAANSKFRMWYSAGASYEPVAVGYAESTDGITWVKNDGNPIFSADINRLWEKAYVGVGTVIVYGGYYYMFYISYRTANEGSISVARSVDGITAWERHAENPLIRKSQVSTEQDYTSIYRPGVILDDNTWRCWYNGRNDSLTYTENIMLAEHAGADLLW